MPVLPHAPRAPSHLHAAELQLFESDAEALQDLLAWLVASFARIKALMADAAGGAGAAAQAGGTLGV